MGSRENMKKKLEMKDREEGKEERDRRQTKVNFLRQVIISKHILLACCANQRVFVKLPWDKAAESVYEYGE